MQDDPYVNNLFMRNDSDQKDKIESSGSSSFLLAAVYSVNPDNSAVTLLLDGTDSPTQKYYKALTGAWPLVPDDRVIVLKMSGTYVVVGKIGGKPDDPDPPTYIAAPNTVFAGPATGETSAEATFRALTKDDIPGGGDVKTIIETVVANIMTPISPASVSKATFAYCGKYAVLNFTYRVGTAMQYDSSSAQIATLLEACRPATDTQVIMQRLNSNFTKARIETMLWIRADGTITHCGEATYNGDLECTVAYLLP